MTTTEAQTDDIKENTQVVQAYATMFELADVATAGRRDFERLSAGTLGALRIRSLLDPTWCAEIMKATDACQFDTYDERRIYPPVTKFGPSAYDYYLSDGFRPEYWIHAESSARTWRSIVGDRDPMDAILDQLRESFGGQVERATVGGRPLFAGMLRELTGGGRMHFDEVSREFPGVLDEEPVIQFGFNCHLSVPETGGELSVFRRRWRPTDDTHRVGYGWDERIAGQDARLTLRADVGDGVFFDCRNYHAIAPSGSGRRLTLSFFAGITMSGRMVVWS